MSQKIEEMTKVDFDAICQEAKVLGFHDEPESRELRTNQFSKDSYIKTIWKIWQGKRAFYLTHTENIPNNHTYWDFEGGMRGGSGNTAMAAFLEYKQKIHSSAESLRKEAERMENELAGLEVRMMELDLQSP